jgi:hypothetical protein
MGEGWSDAFAEWLEHQDASIPDFVLGVFVLSPRVLLRLISIPVGFIIIPPVSARSHIPLARTLFCIIPLWLADLPTARPTLLQVKLWA